MITQPVAIIADVDNDGVLVSPSFLQSNENTPDVTINQGDLPAGVGDDLMELVINLGVNTAMHDWSKRHGTKEALQEHTKKTPPAIYSRGAAL
ncbi:hypothetical protein [Planktotalea arctica]|uniref:hypothetical protein n=1 Tax=Planktotalea arctica TaxID=1481893 RepID=UPI0032198461